MLITKKISEKDVEIISHLRKNARNKVTTISRSIEMPVTTIYDRVKVQHNKGIIKKSVALLDFNKIGFNSVSLIALKTNKHNKEELKEFLHNHSNINSLYRINNGHDFLAECIFEDANKLQDFIEETEWKFDLQPPAVFNIIHELKKEEFMTDSNHYFNRGEDKNEFAKKI